MSKKKSKYPSFVAIPRATIMSKEWRGLSSSSKVLYIHLKYKYVGDNNGDLILHYSELKEMMSSGTISKSFKELEKMGWIERTKIGGLYRYQNKYKLTGKFDNAFVNPNSIR